MPAEHLLLLSQKLVDVAMGRTKRLIVCMPPRHGKSELISRYTPAWYLGRWPDKQVMLCSYSDQFANTWGRRARDTFKEWGPKLFDVRVNPETAGGGQWEVLGREGIMVTAGVGGGITGKGANLLIIDDPVKNAQDAASEIIQQTQIDWWKSTARPRLMPDAGVVLVMTRWHEADLAGNLIEQWMNEDGDAWEILSLPGLAEGEITVSYPPSKTLHLGPDPLGREVGEALWPGVEHMGTKIGYDVETLEATRRAQGTYWFNAMYQQRPSSAEGNLFMGHNFRYYTRSDVDRHLVTLFRDSGPEVVDVGACLKFCTVDCAESEKKNADYSVIATWVVTPQKDLLLWDRERVQFTATNLKPLIRRTYFTEAPQFIAIEKKSAGTAIIEELVLAGLPVIALEADDDKITRSLPMAARYEEKRVFHPKGPGFEWVASEWEPELKNFPNARNDDQVDVAAYAGMQLPTLGGGMSEAAARTTRSGKGKTIASGLLKRQL